MKRRSINFDSQINSDDSDNRRSIDFQNPKEKNNEVEEKGGVPKNIKPLDSQKSMKYREDISY